MSEKRFRINLNYNPDENWEPDWQEMTKADYIDEWDSDDATWQEMVKAGAVEEIRDPMTEGAKTGTGKHYPESYQPRTDANWKDLDSADAFHNGWQWMEFSRELENDLTEALKVAGEALDKAEKAIYNLAYTGTVRIRDLGGECDDAATTGDIAFKKSGIEESRAALERIRNKG